LDFHNVLGLVLIIKMIYRDLTINYWLKDQMNMADESILKIGFKCPYNNPKTKSAKIRSKFVYSIIKKIPIKYNIEK